MAKYKILMVIPGSESTTEREMEVDGEPVHFPGFEGFSFFSHKSTVHDPWGSFDDCRITEESTGCSIGGGFTLEEAITKATEQMAKVTPEQFGEMLKVILAKKTK